MNNRIYVSETLQSVGKEKFYNNKKCVEDDAGRKVLKIKVSGRKYGAYDGESMKILVIAKKTLTLLLLYRRLLYIINIY